MLTSDFVPEMGALIRSLEQRVRNDPILKRGEGDAILHDIEDAIVQLCALHIKLSRISALSQFDGR